MIMKNICIFSLIFFYYTNCSKNLSKQKYGKNKKLMRSIIDEISELCDHSGNFSLIIFEIFSCINDKNLFRIMSFKPVLMLNMDLFKIFKWNLIFFRSLSNFGSLVTLFWCASKINNLSSLLRSH